MDVGAAKRKILLNITSRTHNAQIYCSHVVRSVVVAVRVGDDGEPREVVPRAEHRARLHPVSRVPDDEPVSEEVLGCTGDFELDLHLPITGVDGLEMRRMSQM